MHNIILASPVHFCQRSLMKAMPKAFFSKHFLVGVNEEVVFKRLLTGARRALHWLGWWCFILTADAVPAWEISCRVTWRHKYGKFDEKIVLFQTSCERWGSIFWSLWRHIRPGNWTKINLGHQPGVSVTCVTTLRVPTTWKHCKRSLHIPLDLARICCRKVRFFSFTILAIFLGSKAPKLQCQEGSRTGFQDQSELPNQSKVETENVANLLKKN